MGWKKKTTDRDAKFSSWQPGPGDRILRDSAGGGLDQLLAGSGRVPTGVGHSSLADFSVTLVTLDFLGYYLCILTCLDICLEGRLYSQPLRISERVQ
jgi:hypothetical protein